MCNRKEDPNIALMIISNELYIRCFGEKMGETIGKERQGIETEFTRVGKVFRIVKELTNRGVSAEKIAEIVGESPQEVLEIQKI